MADQNTHANDQAMESKTEEQQAASPPESETSEPPKYPTPLVFGINLFALSIAVFCVALDNTIISTAVPRITDQFHALQDVGWYGSGNYPNCMHLPVA